MTRPSSWWCHKCGVEVYDVRCPYCGKDEEEESIGEWTQIQPPADRIFGGAAFYGEPSPAASAVMGYFDDNPHPAAFRMMSLMDRPLRYDGLPKHDGGLMGKRADLFIIDDPDA